MPFYDMLCTDCRKESRIMASISDKTEKRIVCPECGSFNLETLFKSAPYYKKSRKTSDCPNRNACGTNCPHQKI